MKKVLTIAGVTVLALSLTTGAVSAMGSTDVGFSTTGPDSTNVVDVRNSDRRDVRNDNRVDVDNDSDQDAHSGDAEVRRNTTGGSARTGDVTNDNLTRTDVTVSNRGSAGTSAGASNGGSQEVRMTNTGPDSFNKVKVENEHKVEIDNDNDVEINNDSEQDAHSGDAKVTRNTTGGSATTGSVTNVNTTRTSVNIQN